MVTEHSARFDAKNGICYPPTTEISWNSRVKNDDGLLANSFARRMNKSFEEGRAAMRSAIEDLKTLLQNEGEIAIGNIGILCLQESGNLLFMPRSTAQEQAQQLGLDAINLLKTAETKSEKPTHTIDVSPVKKPTSEKTHTSASVHSASSTTDIDNKENQYLQFRIKRKSVNIVASICAMFVIAIGILYSYPGIVRLSFEKEATSASNTNKEITTAAVVPLPKAEVSATVAHNHKTIDTQNKPVTSQADNTLQTETSQTEKTYNLIVATFHHRDEAETYMMQNSKGYYPLEILPGSKVFRISAAKSADRNALLEIKRQKTFTDLYPDAWIY